MSNRPRKSVAARSRQWSMRELHDHCPSACVVWAALRDIRDALDTLHLTPTRQQLSNLSGLRDQDTISKVLKVLHEAKWIIKDTLPVTDNGKITAKVYRITIIRKPPKAGAIDAARCTVPNARSNKALSLPDPARHRAPIQPGIAMPDSTGHESSFGRPAAAAPTGAAVGGEVPPTPREQTDQPIDDVTTPIAGTPIGERLLRLAAPWASAEQRARWERFQQAAKALQPDKYAVAFRDVLQLLELDNADIEAHRAIIQMVGGPDWSAHLTLLAAAKV